MPSEAQRDQSNTRAYYVFDVSVEDVGGGDIWTNWSPSAVVEAVSGEAAIKQVAQKLGEGTAVAVPVSELTVAATRVERRTRIKQVPVAMELLAPELLPPPPADELEEEEL